MLLNRHQDHLGLMTGWNSSQAITHIETRRQYPKYSWLEGNLTLDVLAQHWTRVLWWKRKSSRSNNSRNPFSVCPHQCKDLTQPGKVLQNGFFLSQIWAPFPFLWCEHTYAHSQSHSSTARQKANRKSGNLFAQQSNLEVFVYGHAWEHLPRGIFHGKSFVPSYGLLATWATTITRRSQTEENKKGYRWFHLTAPDQSERAAMLNPLIRFLGRRYR